LTIDKTTDKTGVPATVTHRGKEFTITVDGQTVGVAAFADRGDRRVFVHTEVDDTFQGRGLATILVEEAIKSTKADGLGIVAVCPMVAAFLHKHKEFDDIVDPTINETEMVLPSHPHGGEMCLRIRDRSVGTDVRRVYLARHGRTALNADDRLRGRSDPPLDRVGIAEAARLAQALAAKHPTVVISSPLQRAVATARAIGEAARTAVVIDARLNDRDYGPWNGKPRTEVVRRYRSIDAAPGVEPFAAVASRARIAIEQLVDHYGCGPLVLVSHDAVNRALLEQLDPSLTDIGQRTACWNELDRVDGTWRVDGYDLKPSAQQPIPCDSPFAGSLVKRKRGESLDAGHG
jgi:broad specificity phosphatase PhoE/predicted GNAT family acetyltransferase